VRLLRLFQLPCRPAVTDTVKGAEEVYLLPPWPECQARSLSLRVLKRSVAFILYSTTPVYLADECTLVTAACRRPLRSNVLGQEITQPVR